MFVKFQYNVTYVMLHKRLSGLEHNVYLLTLNSRPL